MPIIRTRPVTASQIEAASERGDFGNNEIIPKFNEWLTEYADNAIMKELPKNAARGIVDLFMGEFLDFTAWTKAGTEAIRQELLKEFHEFSQRYDAKSRQWQEAQNETRARLPASARYVDGLVEYRSGVIEAYGPDSTRYYLDGHELSASETAAHLFSGPNTGGLNER